MTVARAPFLRRMLAGVLLIHTVGCPTVPDANESTEGSDGGTASMVSASTSGAGPSGSGSITATSATGTTSSSEPETDASTSATTTGGAEDPCPAGIDGLESAGTDLVVDESWPEEETDAECTPASHDDEGLRLECTRDGDETAYEFQVLNDEPEINEALASLLEYSDLDLRFTRESAFTGGWLRAQFTLRTPEDDLLLFVYAWTTGALNSPLDTYVDYAPFAFIGGADVRCGERPPTHGNVPERPQGVAFEGDDGVVTVYDREKATVNAGGASYRIVVAGAFQELGPCPDLCGSEADLTVFQLLK